MEPLKSSSRCNVSNIRSENGDYTLAPVQEIGYNTPIRIGFKRELRPSRLRKRRYEEVPYLRYARLSPLLKEINNSLH